MVLGHMVGQSAPEPRSGLGVQGGRGGAFPPAQPSVLRTSPSSSGLCWTQEGDLESSDGGWGDAYTQREPEAPRKGGRGQMPSPAPRPGAPIGEPGCRGVAPRPLPRAAGAADSFAAESGCCRVGGSWWQSPFSPGTESRLQGVIGGGGVSAILSPHLLCQGLGILSSYWWIPVSPRGGAAPSSQGTNVKLTFTERLLHAEPQRRGFVSGQQLWD